MDKYLGDMIHQDGLAASIEATVEERVGRITAAGHEIKAVMDDYRLQAVGGMMGACDLWNLALIPSLINNCSTWIGISSKLVDRLEAIQEKLILEVPVSTPKVALRAETGLLSMKHRIWGEKLNLFTAVIRMKDGLAKQVLEEQIEQGWPGLAQEVEKICKDIEVPYVNMKAITRKSICTALRNHDKSEIMEKMNKDYKKLDKIKMDDPTRAKEYMEGKSLADCRVIFRFRTEMINLKENMKNRYRGEMVNCDACNMGVPESQAHVMSCTGYKEIRAGKDLSKDGDLVAFFREVLVIREKRKHGN